MPLPKFHTLMLPLLQTASDGREHDLAFVTDRLAKIFNVSAKERDDRYRNGQSKFGNRVQWAKKYLTEARLLTATKRACFTISAHGRRVLQRQPAAIDKKFLAGC